MLDAADGPLPAELGAELLVEKVRERCEPEVELATGRLLFGRPERGAWPAPAGRSGRSPRCWAARPTRPTARFAAGGSPSSWLGSLREVLVYDLSVCQYEWALDMLEGEGK